MDSGQKTTNLSQKRKALSLKKLQRKDLLKEMWLLLRESILTRCMMMEE